MTCPNCGYEDDKEGKQQHGKFYKPRHIMEMFRYTHYRPYVEDCLDVRGCPKCKIVFMVE